MLLRAAYDTRHDYSILMSRSIYDVSVLSVCVYQNIITRMPVWRPFARSLRRYDSRE